MDVLGGQDLPWFNFSEDRKTLMPATPIETFYNDVSDKATLDGLTASLRPHSYGSFSSKNTYEPWMDVASTYFVCTDDQAIPVEGQKGMVESCRKAIAENSGKGSMDEVTIKASHSPFVSQPEETSDAIRRIAGESI